LLNNPKVTDIYVCMSLQRQCAEKVGRNGTFKIAVRNRENAVKLKSLFLDVDAKDYGGGVRAAGADLGRWVKDSGMLKPTTIVMSGGGLHVYWELERALTPDEWLPKAHRLIEATKRHGLKCDTAVTTDTARILRVPGTFNYKRDPRRSVELVWCA
jgi:hypothetical protein